MTLGNGVTYNGASVATAVGHGTADRRVGRRPGRRRPDGRCAVLRRGGQRRRRVLDPAKVAGKIVVCDRGVTARVNKSLAVQDAGGVGHDPGQHQRQLAQRRLPLRADRPPPEHRPRRRQGLCGHGRRHGDHQPGDASSTTAGPVHRVVLVARPAARRRRRPAQARPHRPRPGHPGRASRPPGNSGTLLRPVQRHVDVQPARGRPRGAAQGTAPGLVADGDQVGADDDRLRRPRRPEHQPAA